MNHKSQDLKKAGQLLKSYGGEIDDFFKLWPEDKTYFFSSDNQAFIAYAVKYRVVICMGDPVGSKKSIQKLLREFKLFCDSNKWIMAFIQTTDKYKQEYEAVGLRSLLIGADAVINLEQFTTVTLHSKYFRNLVNRYDKQGFSLVAYPPPHNEDLISELLPISASWMDLPHKKEWSFLTGRFDIDYLNNVTIYVLRDREGIAQAFANELPSFKKGVVSIDMMRHRADAPSNSIDLLFISLFRLKQASGHREFNLGMSPLDAKHFMKNKSEKLLIQFYVLTNSFIGFKGLHQFKAKYLPGWEPRYVWYHGKRKSLGRIGMAVYSLLRG